MPFQPGPFPGMDPYIEARWANAHARLIGSTANAPAPRLTDDLIADVVARVRNNHDEGDWRGPRPDVGASEQPSSGWGASRPVRSAAVLAQPLLLPDPGPAVERSIRILDADGGRVVTAIEFLSPWNKRRSGGRREYLRKRRAALASDVNLVEVDLVRGGGDWTAMVQPFDVPPSARAPYRVTVARAHPAGGPLGLHAIRLDERLPVIRVPLRPGEPDVTLGLQPLVDDVYRTGRYDRTDYGRDCDPPRAEADAAWADRLLREAGRRP